MHKIYQTNKYPFFVGDFNVNTIEAMITSDRYVNEFHNTFLTYFYHPLINKPTRVYKTKSSLLDNMYTNFPNINACGILKTLFSDHYSLFCIAKEKQNNKNNITVTKREFTERNIIIIIIIIFWLKHQYLKHKYQSMVQQIIANMLSETVYTGITNLYIITRNQQNTKQYIINVNSVF